MSQRESQDPSEVESDVEQGVEAETDKTGSKLTRRKLLAAAAASAAGAAVLPGTADAHHTIRLAVPLRNANIFDISRAINPNILKSLICNSWAEPAPISPVGGVTSPGDLNVDLKTFNYCDGNSGQVRSFNNLTPSATLVTDPGGTISFTLKNNLANNPAPDPNNTDKCNAPNNMNLPHCFNSTNVHFHGLHVSPCSIWPDNLPNCDPGHGSGQPTTASDDVLFEIKPTGEGGQPQDYCVEIPDFHAPGTHWYHSHKHGSTAIQVANGMAGALIVRENNPNLINVMPPAQRDHVFLIQEVLPDSEDWKIYPGGGQPTSRLLVNGQCLPCMPVFTGQNHRIRMINATGTPRGFTRLQLVKDPNNAVDETVPPAANTTNDKKMWMMAVDGITFYGHTPQPIGHPVGGAPNTRWWDLSPGNRLDVLLQFAANETGVWKIIRLPVPGVQAGQNMGPNNPPDGKLVLACIDVKAGNFNDPDPSTIQLGTQADAPAYIQPIQKTEICGQPKEITFNVGGAGNFQIGWKDPNTNPPVNVPPQQYDGSQFIETFLGCAEAWQLINTQGAGPFPQPHPFHIHVNPFQLVDGNFTPAPTGNSLNQIRNIDLSQPDAPGNRIWWDTIAIPANGNLTHWTRFWDYPGTFVLHCHILVHEDQGMMANVWVRDPKGEGIGPCEKAAQPIPVNCQGSCRKYKFLDRFKPRLNFDPQGRFIFTPRINPGGGGGGS